MNPNSLSRECIDCRGQAPRVETDYTLISSRFGWRLSRRVDTNGNLFVEWRCPKCWARHKQEQTIATPPPSQRRPLAVGEKK